MKAKVTEAFIDLLENGADVHRCAAARGLGVLGGGESLSALTRGLLDEDPDVRTDAATALSRLKNPTTAKALMENLIGDPESDVKIAAIRALVAMKYEPVLPILRKLVVTRSEEDVAWDEDAFYADGWDSWLDVQLESLRGLAELGDEQSVALIVTAMTDEFGQDISEQGVSALAALGRPGADALQKLLAGASTRLRRQIARAVAAGDNDYVAPLQDALLQAESQEVRLITLDGLPVTDPRLEHLMADENDAIRAAAVKRAGARFPARVKELIEDDSPAVRAEVFKVIGATPDRFKSKDVVEKLKAAITGDAEAAKQAALALMAMKGPKVAKGIAHVLTREDVPLEFRLASVEVMKKAGNVSVPALLAAAGVPERQLRLAVLTALVDFAADDPVWPNKAGAGLLAALKGELVPSPEEDAAETDPQDAETAQADEAEQATPQPLTEEEMREIDESLPLVAEPLEEAAAEGTSTLASIAAVDPEAVADPEPELIVLDEAQKHLLELSGKNRLSKKKVALDPMVAPYQDVKRFAARLLGNVVNREVTDNLIEALKDPDVEMRDPILHSLAQHGETTGGLPETAVPLLSDLLEQTSGETRLLVVRAYGWLSGQAVDDKLLDLLHDEDELVRVEAVRGLDRRGITNTALIECLDDKYPGVQVAAARAVARLWKDDGVDALVGFALKNDGTFRRDVGRLLAEFAPSAGVQRLLAVLQDADQRRSWLVAIDALAELYSQPEKPEELKVA